MPDMVSSVYVNVSSTTFFGKGIWGNLPKDTVGGAGGVGKRRSFKLIPVRIKTMSKKIPVTKSVPHFSNDFVFAIVL